MQCAVIRVPCVVYNVQCAVFCLQWTQHVAESPELSFPCLVCCLQVNILQYNKESVGFSDEELKYSAVVAFNLNKVQISFTK